MLTFNLKKQWFDKIKSGEKTHEYREVKPYWTKRLGIKTDSIKFLRIGFKQTYAHPVLYAPCPECTFVCGYAKKADKEKRIKAKIKTISIINGKNTDLAVDKDVYDIEFELI